MSVEAQRAKCNVQSERAGAMRPAGGIESECTPFPPRCRLN